MSIVSSDCNIATIHIRRFTTMLIAVLQKSSNSFAHVATSSQWCDFVAVRNWALVSLFFCCRNVFYKCFDLINPLIFDISAEHCHIQKVWSACLRLIRPARQTYLPIRPVFKSKIGFSFKSSKQCHIRWHCDIRWTCLIQICPLIRCFLQLMMQIIYTKISYPWNKSEHPIQVADFHKVLSIPYDHSRTLATGQINRMQQQKHQINGAHWNREPTWTARTPIRSQSTKRAHTPIHSTAFQCTF